MHIRVGWWRVDDATFVQFPFQEKKIAIAGRKRNYAVAPIFFPAFTVLLSRPRLFISKQSFPFSSESRPRTTLSTYAVFCLVCWCSLYSRCALCLQCMQLMRAKAMRWTIFKLPPYETRSTYACQKQSIHSILGSYVLIFVVRSVVSSYMRAIEK